MTPSERTSVHRGLPVMNGRQAIGSGSVSPMALSGATMIARLDQVAPLSVERMIATLSPRVPWLFWRVLNRKNPSSSVPLGSATIWLEMVPFCVPGSKISRAGSQVGLEEAPLVVRANQTGWWNACAFNNAVSGAFSFGETNRSHTAYTRLPLGSVRSAVSDSLSLKLLPSGSPAREVSNFSVNGSLQVADPWGSLAARTALRVVVLSTDRLIDHKSPLGAHDTHGSDERPKSPPLAALPPAQRLKCGVE